MILVRHGQSEFNVVYGETRKDPGIVDPQLTELGRRQAAATAKALAGGRAHRIVASPYRRAVQTALIINETLNLPITIDPMVGERAAFICDIGTPGPDLSKLWPDLDFSHLPETWWPAIEEPEESLDARGRSFRDRMRRHEGWEGVVVVTHWGFIRTLTGHRVGNATAVRFDPHSDHPGGGTVVSIPDV
jgi:broad specificity phosphatase PhoE